MPCKDYCPQYTQGAVMPDVVNYFMSTKTKSEPKQVPKAIPKAEYESDKKGMSDKTKFLVSASLLVAGIILLKK